VYSYLDRTQIKEDEDNRELYFRHVSKGGWPFSTAAHGWPISDCTAEGLKAVLALHKDNSVIPLESRISKERLQDAVDVILSYHNKDGGWATYENNRGYGWYELLNPSEVFGDIMIDYSYVECSSACITALKSFSKLVPDYRSKEVLNAIQAGRKFLKSIQRNDGSWYGSWGVCFTYGTWFGIEGLITAGEDTTSPAVEKAVNFLLSKQNSNGGWGESYVACVDKAYPVDGTGCYGDSQSGVVQTAWAVLGLLIADCKDKAAIDKGVKYILSKQLSNGDWDQEGITGVFNRSCGITYTAYRNVFPIWALVRYANKYE
jgi:squalene/oxidosqualene cyclase-like protein